MERLLLVWVDDIILVSTSDGLMDEIKNSLKNNFNMKDLGPLSSFLGIRFNQNENEITMDQSQYLANVLNKYGMESCKARSTPCELKPSAYDNGDDDICDESKYREIVGTLVYAMTCTRPDLCFIVTKLSQYLAIPTKRTWIMLMHVLRYIKGKSRTV